MTIKKTQGSGAAIADRFKLDVTDPSVKKAADKGTTYAMSAGLVALAVMGVLTYLLYAHWDYLMPW